MDTHLVTFIKNTTYEDLPEQTLERIKLAFADTVGVAIAAEREPVVEKLLRRMPMFFGKDNALAFALLFGTMAHALDYDDNSITFQGHPSAVLVPTIFAVAREGNDSGVGGASEISRVSKISEISEGSRMSEVSEGSGMSGVSGKEMLTAYAVGFEVLAKLSEVFVLPQYERGWHTTATIGIFGAVASAAHLWRLPEREISHALGMAASLAAGMRKNFGTMTKPLHVGFTCLHAVMAVQLASAGVNANEHVFSGPLGLDRLMADVDGDFTPLSTLGHPWDVADTGITMKKYPCCASTHRAIDAVLALVREHDLLPEQIERVDVYVHHTIPSILVYPQPQSELEAKFSMPFCLAAAICEGQPDMATFAKYKDPRLRELGRKVHMYVHPLQKQGAAPREQFAEVSIKARGKSWLKRVDCPRGHPGNPMSVQEAYDKFARCTAGSMSGGQQQRLFDTFLSMEDGSTDEIFTSITCGLYVYTRCIQGNAKGGITKNDLR